MSIFKLEQCCGWEDSRLPSRTEAETGFRLRSRGFGNGACKHFRSFDGDTTVSDLWMIHVLTFNIKESQKIPDGIEIREPNEVGSRLSHNLVKVS